MSGYFELTAKQSTHHHKVLLCYEDDDGRLAEVEVDVSVTVIVIAYCGLCCVVSSRVFGPPL